MLKLVLSARCRSINQEELFEFAKKTGFDGIDYVATLKDLLTLPKKVTSQNSHYKLPILSVHQPLPLIIYAPSFFFQNIFKINKLLGSKLLNMHLSALINPFQKSTKIIMSLLRLARAKNVSVCFESNNAMFPFTLFPKQTYDPNFFAQFCQQYDLPITFDTCHIASNNHDILDFFRKYKRNIRLIHLSDFDGSKQHLPLGDGKLPLRNLLREIKKFPYAKLIVFEINNFLEETTKEDKLKKIKASFEFVDKLIK